MKRLAVMFPGQGSQYGGMMKRDYENYTIVRHTFEEASDALGYDIASLCFDSSEEMLARSELTQPALLAAGVAAFRLLIEETGIEPIAAAGHSLGEYTALACAGVLRFPESLRLVRERGRLMMEASAQRQGRMLAVTRINADETVRIIDGLAESIRPAIACFNSFRQTVLSGSAAAMAAAEERLAAAGAKLTQLKVSGAFHSPLMAPAAAELEGHLRNCAFGSFRFPVITNVEAKPYGNRTEDVISSLKRQMTEPVRWREAVAGLMKRGADGAVELSPGTTLKRLCREDYPEFPVHAFDDRADREAVRSNRFKQEYGFSGRYWLEQCLRAAVTVKNRSLMLQAYRENAVAPYRSMESLLAKLEADNKEPTVSELRKAAEWLRAIMQAKGAGDASCLLPLNEIERMIIDGEANRKHGS